MSLAVASAIINHFLKTSFTGFPRALDFRPFPEPPATLAHASPTHHKLPRETKENGPVKTGCCASFGLVYLIVSGLEGYFSFNINFVLCERWRIVLQYPFCPSSNSWYSKVVELAQELLTGYSHGRTSTSAKPTLNITLVLRVHLASQTAPGSLK